MIEQKCKLLIDGILGTLVIFLVLELLICITAMLFGLSAIQIVIGALILCLSASVLQIHEVHFTGDVALFLIVVIQVTLSGAVLVHSGRKPTLFWVKCSLVLHLISAAFATAALGLMSKHLPYRQDSYHCEHCRRLELHAVLQAAAVLAVVGVLPVGQVFGHQAQSRRGEGRADQIHL
ncbi:unnamed protein product [Menidia menidia]|uniref:(Atlantic silverside) hypothetical protein n=1 Tax=Menidia menidia TaxID=238744 RepID=A0A8S4AZ36_9TELE|nr:unnamed protein product [Menidia menidia]